MDKQDYELVIVDDKSTDSIKDVIKPYLGKINIRHIIYDHTKHPIWQELNPNGVEQEWYHTQAISANIGINQAQGDIVSISQPEILHSPWSFYTGHKLAMENRQVFGEIIMAGKEFNYFSDTRNWEDYSYDSLLEIANNFKREYTFNHQPPDFYEMYWHVLYLPKSVAVAVNGVDLRYQRGVYAEDDQFKMRVRMAGTPEVWGGRPNCTGRVEENIVGIHQSHLFEKHDRQVRDSVQWNKGAEYNRKMFAEFQQSPYTVANENLPYDVWGSDIIIENNYYAANLR